MDKNITETSFEKAKEWAYGEYMDEDLILLDRLADAPFPKEPRRMNFILIGLCTKGSVRYRMDMQEQLLTPGHVIIASERHVIDQYEASPDLEGMCMMVTVPFYNEIMSNVNDLSALYLFAHHNPIFEFTPRYQQIFKEYCYTIRTNIADTRNRFRRDLVRTLMLAMFYELSNVIYDGRIEDDKHNLELGIILKNLVEINIISSKTLSSRVVFQREQERSHICWLSQITIEDIDKFI